MKRWRDRVWRRSHQSEDYLLPTYDDTELLDTEEQEKIVRSFELSHQRQSFVWRGIFTLFAASFGAFFIYSAYQQAISPWNTRYHSYFIDEMNEGIVIMADLIEAAAFVIIAWGVLTKRTYLIWASFKFGLGLALFWLYYILRLSIIHWNILWIPLGPSMFAAVCLYVNHLLLETENEMEAIRSSIYHFKKT
eukprot:c23401_g1_i1 orf=118-693(+)